METQPSQQALPSELVDFVLPNPRLQFTLSITSKADGVTRAYHFSDDGKTVSANPVNQKE